MSRTEYKLFDVKAGQEVVEFIPQMTGKIIQCMYSWDRFASNIRLQIYTKLLTSYCGGAYAPATPTTNNMARCLYYTMVFLHAPFCRGA